MEFREVSRRVLKLVEDSTGIVVRVTQDPTLATLAKVRMATRDVPVHLITYNPNKGAELDYVICCECGFILRLFACPPEQRRVFAVTDHGRQSVRLMLETAKGAVGMARMPVAVRQQLADQLFNGVMIQLRSVPIGMRVDNWLRRDFPELRELQETSVKKQMQDNSQVLAPQVRQLTPEVIYRASVAMNAAMAHVWSGYLSEPRFEAPYKPSVHWELATRLVGILEAEPDSPEGDYRLVDRWAEACGLTGYYEWRPYET